MAQYSFEDAIQKYCDEEIKVDKEFAEDYKKPNKSVKEACNYIIGIARKSMTGGVCGISDQETFGLVKHYFHEDDIKVDVKDAVGAQVGHAPEAVKPKLGVKRGRKGKAKEVTVQPKEQSSVEQPKVETKPDDGWQDLTLDIPLF